ncbi:MAG: hypothetical protein E3K40_15785 [Candidatus Brocadia sp.]|nr:hypothetical protein [Candidatus Brocadia sp.]
MSTNFTSLDKKNHAWIRPSARQRHTAVWTGTEMIVWGGRASGSNPLCYFNTGGRYNPATNTWSATNTTGAPLPRSSHTAVWTGTEMIVWSGLNLKDPGRRPASEKFHNDGGRYNPATNTWVATTTTGAPSGRQRHTAVWTGTKMIVGVDTIIWMRKTRLTITSMMEDSTTQQ